MTISGDMKKAVKICLDLTGNPCTFTDTAGNTTNGRFTFNNIKPALVPEVNTIDSSKKRAYMEGVINPPSKFDVMTVPAISKTYTVTHVEPVLVDGVLVCYELELEE